MEILNKVGATLRRSVSTSSALNSQSAMLSAIRCMSSKLFIEGLSHKTDDQTLKNAFSRFGDVTEVQGRRPSSQARQIGLPQSRVLYTVLRSPHIDKKSREQFEMRIKKQLFVMKVGRNELCRKFFWLKRARIIMDSDVVDGDSGRSRRSGFVKFADDKAASAALSAMNGKELDGRPIRVSLTQEKSPSSSYKSGGGVGMMEVKVTAEGRMGSKLTELVFSSL